MKSKAELYEQWAERWARNPSEFMQQMNSTMSPGDQKAFSAMTGAEEAPPAEMEAVSPVGEWTLKHKSSIEALPKFAESVDARFVQRDQFLNDALIEVHALKAQSRAI